MVCVCMFVCVYECMCVYLHVLGQRSNKDEILCNYFTELLKVLQL